MIRNTRRIIYYNYKYTVCDTNIKTSSWYLHYVSRHKFTKANNLCDLLIPRNNSSHHTTTQLSYLALKQLLCGIISKYILAKL